MARTADVVEHLRRHAEIVPDDILARLSRAELRARCEAAEEHHMTSKRTGDPEHARYLLAHARKVLRSQPVVEYIEELRRLASLTNDASDRDVKRTYRDARVEHEQANAFPPGLVLAVDRAILGQATTPDTQEIAAHHAR
jgi:hypothetical protein